MIDVWELPARCPCWYCKGGRNKHTWAFYYFCKKCGDRVTARTKGNKIVITVKKKADHVRRAKQTRKHYCHWPGCDKQVPPAKWGCKEHWFKLPMRLRNRIWASYSIGQEINMTPSKKYLEVAREVQNWIKEHYPPRRKRERL